MLAMQELEDQPATDRLVWPVLTLAWARRWPSGPVWELRKRAA
jgi:hypothetical protein